MELHPPMAFLLVVGPSKNLFEKCHGWVRFRTRLSLSFTFRMYMYIVLLFVWAKFNGRESESLGTRLV